MKNFIFVQLVISFILASTGIAFPLPRVDRNKAELPLFFTNEVELPLLFTKDYDFEGIVELDDCSGSLIRFESSKPTDLALILTNGHCVELGMPRPGKIVFRKPSSRKFVLLDSQGERIATVRAREILYATMTKTDIAVYQINKTYADIFNQYKIRPLLLAKTRPVRQMSIDIVSGYWHRGYSCSIEEFAFQLREDMWTFEDSIRYSRPGCETIGGTSGSPIIETGTRTVVGINNTGNEDGEKCTLNNPCEIDRSGHILFKKGFSYGQQTYWIYSCLDDHNQLDLSIPGCLLPH